MINYIVLLLLCMFRCVYGFEKDDTYSHLMRVLGNIETEYPIVRMMEKNILTGQEGLIVRIKCPDNKLLRGSVSSIVDRELAGKVNVEFEPSSSSQTEDAAWWFPGSSVLFPPLIADVRGLAGSVYYRFGDEVFGKHIAHATMKFDLVFILFKYGACFWQIELEGGVWALFNLGEPSHGHVADLQNADYFIGIPICGMSDSWAFKVRIYHISCHIGDDFIGALLSFPGEYEKQIEWGNKPIRQHLNVKVIEELRSMTNPLLYLMRKLGLFDRLEKLEKAGTAEAWDVIDVLSCLNVEMLSPEERALIHAYKNLVFGWVFANKPSYEVIDWYMSLSINPMLRVYLGIGIYIRNNPSFDQGKGFWQMGAEWRIIPPILVLGSLYLQVFSAFNVFYSDMHCWDSDVTYMFGVELSKDKGMSKKVRVFGVSHQGFAQSGMFRYGEETSYSVGISYGF